jgi:hypothetical protein
MIFVKIPGVSYDVRGLIETMESVPRVSLKQRDPIPRCHRNCRILSHSSNDTAESASMVLLRLWNCLHVVVVARIVHVRSRSFIEAAKTNPKASLKPRELILQSSDGHTFVHLLQRYRYRFRYIVSNNRYKRTPSVICL